MAKLMLKTVNKALKALGAEEELVKGEGYYYFCEGEAYKWPATMVYVYSLNQLTLEEWIEQYQSLKADFENAK